MKIENDTASEASVYLNTFLFTYKRYVGILLETYSLLANIDQKDHLIYQYAVYVFYVKF